MYEGDSSLWGDFFPDGLVPEIVDLICQAWNGVKLTKSNRREVPITKKLYCSLQWIKKERNKGPNRLPFSIFLESSVIDTESASDEGRLDIRFVHGHRGEDVYFAVECK